MGMLGHSRNWSVLNFNGVSFAKRSLRTESVLSLRNHRFNGNRVACSASTCTIELFAGISNRAAGT